MTLIKILLIGTILMVAGTLMLSVSEGFRRPDNLQQCINNCYKAYAGNNGAIQSCINRCRSSYGR